MAEGAEHAEVSLEKRVLANRADGFQPGCICRCALGRARIMEPGKREHKTTTPMEPAIDAPAIRPSHVNIATPSSVGPGSLAPKPALAEGVSP
jgi:hypothetical protein